MERERLTRQDVMDLILSGDLPESGELRVVQVYVPGREITLAHVIGRSVKCVNQNLGLEIGFHQGEDHTGEAVGLLQFTPWESVVIASDIAVKEADVQIGFMDRFCGALILMGRRNDVKTSMEAILRYFESTLGFTVCELSEK